MTPRGDKLTCLDLFCGCGGFSLGMQRAGYRVLAAIDHNEEAIATFKDNFPKETLALCKDLTTFTPDKLAAKLGTNSVDVIVGGPPCQGFSTVRQVDAANHGSRVRKDKRRYLFRVFLDYVAAFRPRVFVMENVLGIQSAAKGKFFTRVQAEARALGYRVQAQVEESWKLGVPQKRRRQLVIGVRNDIPGYFPGELGSSQRVSGRSSPKLWDAIGDLPVLAAGAGDEEREYDLARRTTHIATRGGARSSTSKLFAKLTGPKNSRRTPPARTVSGTCGTSPACAKASIAARQRRGVRRWSSSITARASRIATNASTVRSFALPSSPTSARTG